MRLTKSEGFPDPYQPYEPTAGDIRRECKRIRRTWTERERLRRAGRVEPDAWTPPIVSQDFARDDEA